MVHRNEVDFAVTNFYANMERSEVADLSTILDYQGWDKTGCSSTDLTCLLETICL